MAGSNTVENGVVFDATACAITYGGQLAAYDYHSQEPIDLKEDLPDFPKDLAVVRTADGRPHVVVGGRGGYLSLFGIGTESGTGSLIKLLDVYLPRPGLGQLGTFRSEPTGIAAVGPASDENLRLESAMTAYQA